MRFKWEQGRQGTGYRKLLLATNHKTWDLYLLDYPKDTYIKPHIDPVPSGKHYRLNIILCGSAKFNGQTIFSFGNRVHFFRPDIITHSIDNVIRRRIVLSLGWVVK